MTGIRHQPGRAALRYCLLAVSVAALVLGLASATGATTRRPAASRSSAVLPTGTRPGPTAVSDARGNTYTFWRGAKGQLWEDRYHAATRSWSGAHMIAGMRELESAPAAALLTGAPVSTLDGLYVFWVGRGGGAHPLTNDLWYAYPYPDGIWSGPYLASSGPVTSAPAVTTDNAGHLYIFWRNAAGDLDEITCEGGRSCGGGAPQEVTANGHMIGPMGSAPAVGVTLGGGFSKLDSGSLYVFWRGTGAHRLWVAYLRFGRWWGPRLVRDTNGHVIGPMGSGPTVGLSGPDGWLFWQNAADRGLEETTLTVPDSGPHLGPKAGRFAPQHQAKIAVRLASAPFLTFTFGQACVQSVFWKGRDADLWWACYHKRWYGPTDLHAGPIG